MNRTEPIRIQAGFMNEVTERSGQMFNSCFQCRSCSGGCPMAEEMDYLPNEIIRMVQLGMKQEVLESQSIWFCVGCLACVSECPNGISLPEMMDTLRQIALEEKVTVKEPEVVAFHQEFLGQVKRYGRLYELGFMARYRMKSLPALRDIPNYMKFLFSGRLSILPEKINKRVDMKKLNEVCHV
ncbi:4Fe-4S dicluster domain-containing protein [Desulfoluna sp.]|uniref:4Fe-4S dicluster domain-containing protein n=1 Tax=Desulfoluna sp. TaxID=2045199 RepID=UPI002604F34C|nr:4Fe-4S dicluster domain-containing protein [Desulfoluna sp.]